MTVIEATTKVLCPECWGDAAAASHQADGRSCECCGKAGWVTRERADAYRAARLRPLRIGQAD